MANAFSYDCPATKFSYDLASERDAGRFTVYDSIVMLPGGREELIEEMASDYPHVGIWSQHDRYANKLVPFHWHQELELVLAIGEPVEYSTPHSHAVLSRGMCALVNANVVHSTVAQGNASGADLLVHMFRPQLLAEPGSRLWSMYITPFISATSIELLVPDPSTPEGLAICEAVTASFETYRQGEPGWELKLRNELADIWLALFQLAQPRFAEGPAAMPTAAGERVKKMLDFVSLHYAERIGVPEIAAAAFASERECHRTFKSQLGVSPAQYLRDYRVQQACRLLAHTTRPMAQVAEQSGLGTPSHFGQVFREAMDCTPSEYRALWQRQVRVS